MPGIYGIFSKTQKFDVKELNNVFSSMTSVLSHTNGEKKCKLDLNNFKIGKINLPNDPVFYEPIWNQDHTVFSILDGSIYTYQKKSGKNDVSGFENILIEIMKEYESNGKIEIEGLHGEYNLVLFDAKNEKLNIANDRWGFRELFYYYNDEIFIFASEVKGILQYGRLERRINTQSMMDFLNYGYVIGDRSLIEGINLLPPASFISVNRQAFIKKSLDFKFQVNLPEDNFDDYVDKTYSLLNMAVQRRINGRKKIAVTLSGGLDSRIITGLLHKNNQKLDTFSFGNKYCKEVIIAQKVCGKLSNCQHQIVVTKPEDIIKNAESVVWLSDGHTNLSAISTYFGDLRKIIKEYDLLMGGFFGDVILGGSFTSLTDTIADIPAELKLDRLKFRAGAGLIRPFVTSIFPTDIAESLDYYAVKSIEEEFKKISKSIEFFPFQQDLFIFLTRCRRGYNINRGLIGHTAIEEFYPFFDDDLFNFLYSLPPKVRMNHRLYIAIYKKYFSELADIPWFKTGVSLYKNSSWAVKIKRDIYKYIDWQVKRRSNGRINIPNRENYAPHNYWYRTNKSFRYFINGILLDKKTTSRGFFKENGVLEILKSIRIGWDYFYLIDRLCVLELWCRLFLDGEDQKYNRSFNFDHN